MKKRMISKKNYEWWHTELGGRFLLPLGMGVVGIILSLISAPPQMKAHWTVLVTALCACIGWVLDDLIRWHLRERRTDKKIDWISSHLENLSVYHAFHTDNSCLEELLYASHQITGKTRWLIPLFISKKLSAELRQKDMAEFSLDTNGYSRLLSELLPYCAHFIYMTCPYAPATWFKKLLQGDRLTRAFSCNLAEEEFPIHVRQLLLLKDVLKRRFVILRDENELESFCTEAKARDCFLKYSNSVYRIDTKFAYQPKLCEGCSRRGGGCDVWKRDYQIWDGLVAIEYDDDEEKCIIWVKPHDPLMVLFNECWQRPGTYSLEEIMTYSKQAKKNEVVLERWGNGIKLRGE